MTYEDAKNYFDKLLKEGRTEEDIAKTLYLMFANDQIDLSDLQALLGIIGYELQEEFFKMTPEQQKHMFDEEYDPLGDVVDELYYLCSYDIITQKQLTDILKILNKDFKSNYLERFKIKKERANKED